jgi:DNA-binding MarR family transcriptional regulator
MASGDTARLIQDFLGSAHIFYSAVGEAVEKRLLREVAGSQLTFSQLKLLRLVDLADAQSISDVAAFLGVSNAAASKAVDRLVRRELLLRAEGKTDRRAIHLSLTAKSRRLLSAYEEARERELTRIFQRFPEPELRGAAQLLDRLSAGILEHEDHQAEHCFQCGIYFRENCRVRKLLNRNCFYIQHRDQKRTSGAG